MGFSICFVHNNTKDMTIQIKKLCRSYFINSLISNRINSKKEARQRNRARQYQSEGYLHKRVKGGTINKNHNDQKSSGVYYSAPGKQRITGEVIDELCKIGEEESLDLVRLCLHKNEESILMTMLIVIRNKYTYTPYIDITGKTKAIRYCGGNVYTQRISRE